VGHAGGNIDPDTVRRWAKKEFRGKRICNLNTGFDVHHMYKWDVDLEAQGCTVSDVGHTAGLLDDHRRHFSLESISQDYLGVGKLKDLDVKRMAEYHAADVEPYAIQDVNLVDLLLEKMEPLIAERELGRVQQLEDELIFPTCEMERNGAPLDMGKLRRWASEAEQKILRLEWEINEEAGFKWEPKRSGMQRMFNRLGLHNPYTTATGKRSYNRAVLKQYEHELVRKAQNVLDRISQFNKFLKGYLHRVGPDGVIRFSLHQLRGDKGGTVSGRYSSSELDTGYGINIQQVAKPSKQIIKDFIIRELFIPEPGSLWFHADARQIEYRLFAHFANVRRILDRYVEDPLTDFHNVVLEMVRPVVAAITRNQAKDLNFAKIYGAGLAKIAAMLGVDETEAARFVNAYDRAFPEAKMLLQRASRTAKERGFVRTMLGRRAYFPGGEFLHAALNRVIQGTAADIMKLKIVELHRERKRTGFKMRLTMHDEVDGDVPDLESARMVTEILDRQSLDTRVPILWETGTGANWREAA